MIEVCFDSLFAEKLAYINIKKKRDGKVPNDVYAIDLMLSCGSLKDGIFSENRFKYLSDLSFDKWMGSEAFYTKAEWETAQELFAKIVEQAKMGEEILIWISLAPKVICDFLFLLFEIGTHKNISIINYDKEILLDFSETEYYKLQNTKCALSESDFNNAIESWERIVKIQEPIRALVDGSIVGVEEDFYDDIILSCIPEGEFIAADLFYNLHETKTAFCTHDFLIKRVCNILRSDKIEVVGWKDVVQSPLDLYEQVYRKKSL